MGCPKKFSVGGGMGAALLKDPERASSIIKALTTDPEINIPISCKVRFQETVENTAEFCRLMKNSGACQVALHMRSVDDRPTVRAQWMKFAEVQLLLDFPLIANGDFFVHSDIKNFEENIGNNPIMIARGAQWNPCIFHKEVESGNGLPQIEIVQEFLKIAIKTGTVFQSMKYVVGELLAKSKGEEQLQRQALLQSKATLNVLRIFSLDDHYLREKELYNWGDKCHTLDYYKCMKKDEKEDYRMNQKRTILGNVEENPHKKFAENKDEN
eukprot:GHVP01059254.1.p1 GENE.GHVP01059254.1~~GHVP01059254.1.p1  ORF type:complete len:269 (+),score=69.61 GHVP01059254.1:649-1455(+)